MKFVQQIWQNYGVDGHGFLDQIEARHFVNQYLSDYSNNNVLPDGYFNEWFRKIDKDGDGKVDMIEMAHGIQQLK